MCGFLCSTNVHPSIENQKNNRTSFATCCQKIEIARTILLSANKRTTKRVHTHFLWKNEGTNKKQRKTHKRSNSIGERIRLREVSWKSERARLSVSESVQFPPSTEKKNAFHMGRSQKQSVALTKRKCNRKNAHGEWRHSSRNDYWFRNNNNISIYRKNNEIFSSRTVSLRSKLDLLTPKHQSRRKW